MPKILPAGEHYGDTLQRWSADTMTVYQNRYDRGAAYDVHGNERASLIFVQEGHCSKQMGSERLELAQASMLFIPSERLQADSFPLATTFLAVEFSASFFHRMAAPDLRLDHHIHLRREDAQALGTRLMCELAHIDEMSSLVFHGIILNALACACRMRTVQHRTPPVWLARAKDLLHDCAFESLELNQIAREVDVHPSRLSREFHNFFKVTPGDYLRELRVEKAASYLSETKMALADIALRCGFADQAHLARVFRHRRQISPSEYRRLTMSQKRNLC